MFISLVWCSLRSFKRQGAYIIINVLGLTIGITCSLIISFIILNELSFDRFNNKHKRIFRLIQNSNYNGDEFKACYSPAVIGPTMLKEFPEVEDFLRMTRRYSKEVEYNNQIFAEENLVEADSSFFNFFSIPVIKGDSRNLLNAPRKVVLSNSTAKKIFGDENPVDKMLKIGSDTVRYTVTGVMADIPENSHFEATILISFMTNPRSEEQIWTTNSFSTYLLLKPNISYVKVNEKISEFIYKQVGVELEQQLGVSVSDWLASGNKYTYYLQNLTDIHLDPSIMQEFKEAADPKPLKIIGSLAILIVIIAAINFMNLSTAQASRRAKEVGIKKVSGSTRRMLIIQFLTESFILSFISLVFALIFIKVTLPYINNLLGYNLAIKLLGSWYMIPFLILFTMVVGFLAGSYPALFLSSLNPFEVLKGSVKSSIHNGRLRKVLVVFQFAVSILLIVGTIIMFRQIRYMLNKELGFNKDQIIVITKAENLGQKEKSFQEAINGIPGVNNIVSSSAVPGHNNNSIRYYMDGGKDEIRVLETNFIDYNYLETYGITLVSGRYFNESFTSDQQTCLINESAVKAFGITDLGRARFIQRSSLNSLNYLQVIGVVKDFHFKSLRDQIGPYMFRLKPDESQGRYMSVKLSGSNYSQTISAIENTWKEFTVNKPFQYYFVDDDFDQMYKADKQNARIAVIFSILAIFIASLGLFGLMSYAVEQRTKEIGIRKAMGSSVAGIYFEISKEVIILVTISALIAIPIIYYLAGRWLENFYYRINPGAFSIIAGLTIALSIAIITISYRILRAASLNPSQSLKYE